MANEQGPSDRYSTFSAVSGIAAPIIFAVLLGVGGFVQEGYSHSSQAISELGGVEADTPIIQNLNFVVTGLMIIVLAIGLHRALGLRGGAIAGPMLIGLFGLGTAVAQPIFQCDAGCEGASTTGLLHNLSGLASFLAVIVGMVLLTRRFRRNVAWQALANPTLLAAAAGFVALVAWIAVAKVAEVDELNGVLQRVFAGIVIVWIGVMGAWLWRVSRRTPITTGAK